MRGTATIFVTLLALLAPAGSGVLAAPKNERSHQTPPPMPPDSVWVRMVNDSSLVIYPSRDTIPASEATPEQMIAFEEAYLARLDSINRAQRIADSLMMVRDSLIRAEKIADSIRVARQDSLERVAARIDNLVERGNDFSERYYFAKAYECFAEAESLCSDPEFKAEISRMKKRSDYARSHTRKVPELTVVARALFSVDDFFLYYPLPDKSWRPVKGAPAVYYPGDEAEIHLNRDSALAMIYPMYEGDKMYFASKELPGFGGYDLYCSEWDEALGEWGEPYNMGFPYNSPYDDFLFMTTDDGLYNVFASTRGLGPDGEEVHVYVVLNPENPQYKSVTKPKELAAIAELTPVASDLITRMEGDAIQTKYQEAADRERELRQSLENAAPEERPTIQEELDAVLQEKTRLEEQILSSSNAAHEINREDVVTAGVEGSFPFTRKSFGPTIKIIFDD